MVKDLFPTRRNRIEHDHQCSFFDWIRLNAKKHQVLKLFHAIPNGGARDHGTAIALYLEGVTPGILDTHLPVARNGRTGLWIEFKAGTNDLSGVQREIKAMLEAEGHEVYVVREWTEAARITVAYLGLRGVQVPPPPPHHDDRPSGPSRSL
jgi:hypothetical protein